MNIRTLLLAILGPGLFVSVFPQSRLDSTLSLFDCIRTAQESGPLGNIARRSYESRQFGYESFMATLYPQLSMQGDVPGYYHSINSITLPDGSTVFAPQSQATSAASISLSQAIPFTGGQFSVSSGINRIDLLDTKSQYYRSNPLNVSFRQPIFQMNTLRWNLDEQHLRYQMSTRELAEAMEDCAVDVTNKYFDYLLASMTYDNAALNLANNDTLYRISKGRFGVGKISENDLLQSELACLNAQTELENARIALDNVRRTLCAVLNFPADRPVAVREPEATILGSVDSKEALANARSYRSDVLNFELQKLNAERGVAQARSTNGFTATLSANLGYNQRATQLEDSYRDLLDQRQFSLEFSMPIFLWGAKSAAIDAAIAEEQRASTSVDQQRLAFEQEVLYQVARLNLLRTQVAVTARADSVAQRRFDVAKDRYMIGKIDIPNLFLAQSEKDSARRSRIQTLWNYWSTYFRVRRLTLFDYEARRPLVVQP
ncbi:MAG: TolC family protein [Ignavibacteriales bacterium]|nr:TolC family protein [Ignavibacteriales bacterium]